MRLALGQVGVEEDGIVHDVAHLVDAALGDALAGEVGDGRLSRAEEKVGATSATMRLISSGIRRLKDRRPASTWATGMCSLAAASAPASVELVSP